MSKDQFVQSTVKVNDGSGVIVNPLTDEYSYIYTAKHVIAENPEDPNSNLLPLDKIVVSTYDDIKIKINDILLHKDNDLDIVILQTKERHDSEVHISRKKITTDDMVRFCGYPQANRNNSIELDGYMNHPYKYDAKYTRHIKLRPLINIDFKKIVGMSGGGIFSDSEEVHLRAIETRYSGSPDQYDGCVNAINIHNFDDIIEYNNTDKNKKLSVVLPVELNSFKSLEKFTFSFNDGWDNPTLLKNIRKLLIKIGKDGLTSVDISPLKVKEELEHVLTCDFYVNFEMNEPKYWAAFFELIVVSIIVDEPEKFDQEYLNNILKNRRVIYINSEKTWQKHILSIINNKYNDHDENGFFIVKTNSPSQRVIFKPEKISTLYIDEVNNNNSDFEIDEVQDNENLKKTLIDLHALNNKCIYDDQECLENYNIITQQDKIREKIKDNYSYYLKNEC
ncbi:ABC-three component system protein [Vibrio alginolyticus]|uniref:ABC-three component system protein n=1 Tax=Vibrio alginolyticus TaxID=663 RepID=UPI001BD4CCF8|nr:ABC-three component system protein [Vibrio alginolyticus]EHK1077445.1 trypsin-like peptidase domain-containing protein [Vibrio parahaemolyticus]MBS9891013.1 trypsin-like peptidase domain-containing protein [Vibrio alginolyticus]